MRQYLSLKQWNTENRLHSKMLVVDRLRTGNALMNKLNIAEQELCANLTCRTLGQLAAEIVQYGLAKEEGHEDTLFIDSGMSAEIIKELLVQGGFLYFREEWADDKTCAEIFRIIELFRRYGTAEGFQNAQESKFCDLKTLLGQYEGKLETLGMYDATRLLTEAIHMLKEEQQVRTILGYGNTRFAVLADIRMDELQREFYDCLREGQQGEEIVIKGYTTSLYGKEERSKEYYAREPEAFAADGDGAEKKFFRAYGIANEVEYVAKDILESREAFGNIAVFYPADVYRNYLESIFEKSGIACQFVDGERMNVSDALTLFLDMAKWAEHHFEGKYLRAVFFNPALNVSECLPGQGGQKQSGRQQFGKMIRRGEVTWGIDCYRNFLNRHRQESGEDGEAEYTQRFLGCLGSMVEMFEVSAEGTESLSGFLNKLRNFASQYVRRSAARNALIFQWEQEERFAYTCRTVLVSARKAEYLKESLKDRFLGGGELDAGRVAVYPMGKREILTRDRVYAMGLSAKYLAGKETESAVLSDAEMERCLVNPPETGKRREQQKRYELAASLASAGNGRLTYSYASYDTVEMYAASPSVFFLETLAYAGKRIDDTAEIVYKDFSEKNQEGERQGEELQMAESQEITMQTLCSEIYSVTSMQELLSCPKKFYYHHVLGVQEPDYHVYQPGKWLKANEKGNLVHAVLEKYADRVLIGQEQGMVFGDDGFQEKMFQEIYESCIEEMREYAAVPEEETFQKEKEEIELALREYLIRLHGEIQKEKWCVWKTEYEFLPASDSRPEDGQLKFRGRIDRMDTRVIDGQRHYRVVDYKTGRYPGKENQFAYAVQAVVYDVAIEDMIQSGELEDGILDEPVFEFLFDKVPDKMEDRIQNSREEVEERIGDTFNWIVEEQRYPAHSREVQGTAAECRYCGYQNFCADKR